MKYLSIFSLLLLAACASKRPTQAFENYKVPSAPNYADLQYWAAHPEKKDSADLTPTNAPELRDEQASAAVDVFFLHPTSYTVERGNDQWNGAFDNAKLNEKTDKTAIKFQASIFNGVGRVFAPRYRQAHIFAYYSQDKASAKQAFDVAYSDVKAAFEHYLKNWNKGRPIVIASHSQGTQHAAHLLKDFFDETTLKNRLVVAYIVGLPVPKQHFKNIPICEKPEQTGCFCSWRTFKKGYEPKTTYPLGDSIAIVNPLSMTTDLGKIDKEKHAGNVLIGFKKSPPQQTDAEIHRGILWVQKPQFRGSFFYRTSNYHAGDFNIFYLNIRNDVKRREGLFWKR